MHQADVRFPMLQALMIAQQTQAAEIQAAITLMGCLALLAPRIWVAGFQDDMLRSAGTLQLVTI